MVALPTAALGVVLAIVVSMLVWLGVVLTQHQPATQTAAAITLGINPAVRHYYQNAPGVSTLCGPPAAPAAFSHGTVSQRYRGCTVSGRYSVRANATPTPLPTVRPSATAAPMPFPTIPAPTLMPLPTAAPVPSSTPDCWSDYDRCLLSLINRHRSSIGVAPLTLNATQSGKAALHSQDMAATGSIWHVDSRYPLESFPAEIVVPYHMAGENVGQGNGSPEQGAQQVDSLMWAEGPSGGHYQNMANAAFTTIGLGVVHSGSQVYVTEDFIG